MRSRVLFIAKRMKMRQSAHKTVSKSILTGIKLFPFFASNGFYFKLKQNFQFILNFLSLSLPLGFRSCVSKCHSAAAVP